MKIIISAMSFMIQIFLCASAAIAEFKLVAVDNDTGEAIENVLAHGIFRKCAQDWWKSAPASNLDKKYTDKNGMVQLQGETDKGEVGYYLEKEGYYTAPKSEIMFEKGSLLGFGSWRPDNLCITSKMNKIIHPIPLFVKNPCFDQWGKEEMNKRKLTNQVERVSTLVASYDFIKGEWLPPYGCGLSTDVTIKAETELLGLDTSSRHFMNMRYKTTYTVIFPNAGDGIIEMPFDPTISLKIRTAQETGYDDKNTVTRWHQWLGVEKQHQTSFNKNRCFAFRIRTQRNSKGKIINGYYGKIYGDINFLEIDDSPFYYYLNLKPNDRNLEFDQKTNLYNGCEELPKNLAP